ncbi:M20 family metallopeptidase [Agromyces atrinae]|uniref:Amidohydrolase n=1 Tax=Agromyces atrinae TaxID=592376 RepID=A0A4Q2M483_9MICO|nr:M20 family metallopeptidase [Agromyces atrinae]NYD67304.1 amidohydrolase [Agromyces atrinae]RXZ86865.1 M20 family peptidase [Agromyces atrinae]
MPERSEALASRTDDGVRAVHGIRVGPAPTRPSTAYLDRAAADAEVAASRAEPFESSFAGASAELLTAIESATTTLLPRTSELARTIFDLAETGFAEHRSVDAIRTLLEAEGVPVRVGVFGLDTAFVAELRDGVPVEPELSAPGHTAHAPTITIFAEYDALPGIGHGCGHNLIAASAIGSFLALVRAAAAGIPLPGRVLLYGTPAEEGGNGKELLARAGAFDAVDAAIMVHPFGYDVVDQPFIGRRIVRIVYNGVAAHASASPFQGRNALDAAVLNYQAVGLLRQHLPPGDRLHGIVVDGGERPNVVPERAELEYYVRSPDPAGLRELSSRVDDIAHGIALATGTGVEIVWDPQPFTLPIRHNAALGERWAVAQAARGRAVRRSSAVPSHLAASTDFGNVSVRIPGIHPVIAISPPEVSLHTREFAAHASSPDSDAALTDAIAGLAATAADFLSDPDLRAAVAAEFQAAGGPIDVEAYFS